MTIVTGAISDLLSMAYPTWLLMRTRNSGVSASGLYTEAQGHMYTGHSAGRGYSVFDGLPAAR